MYNQDRGTSEDCPALCLSYLKSTFYPGLKDLDTLEDAYKVMDQLNHFTQVIYTNLMLLIIIWYVISYIYQRLNFDIIDEIVIQSLI